MTQDPRMQRRPGQDDPFGFLGGIPAWLKQVGDPLGAGVQQAAQVPGVQGALTGLSWLDDVFLKSPVGAAALAADALQGGELGRSLDRTNTPLWERPKEAAHRTMGAFQQVAEDPTQPAWMRVAATVPRAAALRGEVLAPLAPGSGAIRGGLRGGLKGAGETLVSEAKQGTVFGQKVGSKAEGLREFAKDFAAPGRPEVRAAEQIINALRARRDATRPLTPQQLTERTEPGGGVFGGSLDLQAGARPPSSVERVLAARDEHPVWEVSNERERLDFNTQMMLAEQKLASLPPSQRATQVKVIEELQTKMYGKPIADTTLAEMWARNGLSYEDVREALNIGRSHARSSRGAPGLHIDPSPYGDGFQVVYRDKGGEGVMVAQLDRGMQAEVPDPKTGDPLKTSGYSVGSMYADDTHPELPTATREVFSTLNQMNAYTGSSLSYWSAKLLHKASVEGRLLSGGELTDRVLAEVDPLTNKPLYPEARVRKMKQGASDLISGGERSVVRVGGLPARPSNLQGNDWSAVENATGLQTAYYQMAVEVAKKHGVKGVVQVRRVGTNTVMQYMDGVEFTFVGKDAEKMKKVAAELGHRFDAPEVEVYHFGGDTKSGVPVGEATFFFTDMHRELQSALRTIGPRMSSPLRMDSVYGEKGTLQGLTLRMQDVSPDQWALFIARLNDRLLRAPSDRYGYGYGSVAPTGMNVRVGRMERLDANGQEATLGRGTGPDAERPAEAGGTGEGAQALGPRGSARDIRPAAIATGGVQRGAGRQLHTTETNITPTSGGESIRVGVGASSRSYDEPPDYPDYEPYDEPDYPLTIDETRQQMLNDPGAEPTYTAFENAVTDQYTNRAVLADGIARELMDSNITDGTVTVWDYSAPNGTNREVPMSEVVELWAEQPDLTTPILQWHRSWRGQNTITDGERVVSIASGQGDPGTLRSSTGQPRVNADGHRLDRISQVTQQQVNNARQEVSAVIEEARELDNIRLITNTGSSYALSDNARVEGNMLHTGGETIPLTRLSHLTVGTGGDVHWDFLNPSTVFGGLIRFVTEQGGAKRLDLGLMDLFNRRRRPERPPEQPFPGPAADDMAEVVPAATRGSRTVGENSEPFVTGGGAAPEPMAVAPEGPVSPGDIAGGRPPQLGPGVPAQRVEAPSGEAAELPLRMTATRGGETRLADVLEATGERQVARMRAITKKVAERQAITGKEAEEIVNGLERAVADGRGDVTHADVYRIKKTLEPVIQAQAVYDSVKDVNDQLADIARQALRMAEKERDRSLAKLLGVDKRAESVQRRIDEGDERLQQRLAKVQADHNARVERVNAAVENALQRMAEGEADAIVRAMSDLDAAAATVEIAEAARFRISHADAERLAHRGYLSPVDKELLDKYGFNTGKYHPVVAKKIANGIRSNIAMWDARRGTITTEESLMEASRYVGVPVAELVKEATTRGLQGGELTSFMLGMRLAVVDQVQSLQKMTKAGASADQIAQAYTEFQQFLLHVGGASSELGRALVSQRTAMTQKLRNAYKQRNVGGVIRTRIVDTERALNKTIERLDAIQAKYDSMLGKLSERQAKSLDAANRKFVDDTKKQLDEALKKRTELEKQLETLRTAEANAAKELREAIDQVRATAASKMAADGGTIDDLKAIIELKGDNLDQLVVAVRNLHRITRGDKAIAYLTNNLFSGIASQEANALGSLFRVVTHVVETAGGEVGGKVGRRLGLAPAITTGETAATLRGIGRAFREGGSGETMSQKLREFRGMDMEEADTFVAAHHGMPKAFEVFVDTMLKGHGTEAGARVAEIGRPTVWGHGKVGLAMEFFNRLNGSFDAVGRHVLNVAEQEALYLKRARQSLEAEGAPVTEAALADRFNHLLLDPPDDILEQAVRISERATYAGKFNPFTEKVLGAIGHRFELPWLGETPVGRFFFAASRFTWAATVYSLETTPLGLVKAGNRLRQARLAGEAGDLALQESLSREAARMGTRGTVGLVGMVWAVDAFRNGNLIGKDHEGRGRDDSIKVGETYIPLKYAWPLSAPLIYTAHVMDAIEEGRLKEQEWPQVMLNASLGWAEALGNQPVLRTINDFMGAIKYGGDQLPRLAARYTGRFIPYSSFLRDVTQMVDAIDRDPRGSLVDLWKENLPLLSMQVNAKVNRWGEPVITKPEGARRVLPFQSLEQAANPADTAIVKLQRTIDPLTKKPFLGAINAPEDHIGDIDLEPDEHAAWQTMAGEMRKKALIDLVGSARFMQADPKQQATLINRHNDRAIVEAKRAFAVELMKDKNAETQLKGVRIGISVTPSPYERVKLVEKMLPVLDQNPDLAKKFDQYKQPDDLTLAQYRQAVRYVPLLEKQPEFSYFNGAPIGTEEQWEEYHRALKHYNQLNKDGRKNEARIYLLRNTVLKRYMDLAKRPGGKNPIVTRMRQRFPVLKYIVLPGREDDEDSSVVRDPLTQARGF